LCFGDAVSKQEQAFVVLQPDGSLPVLERVVQADGRALGIT
jgi:hypothetical protein